MAKRNTETIRVEKMEKHERRAILLMTPAERKAALLVAARQVQASIAHSLSVPYPAPGTSPISA